ncbi:MAG: hypothetical protein UT54_C0041G0009 [Candidatus Daviesbacteria bacterium GW2011_GWB1_39_5]|uniref:Uncharacterized protein n=1 Tax=Candidatus Nomurabacteria bacterium GW2011_GWF2_43_8 TaxID=1618779 RepID=A0A0G1FHN8_9BACT|nr:MAG: hypothetical protein UT54_C0041G0009 [Candidatus Daviesbacteria bacterium GW2011_GWB1_39_5]KKR61002.1 MAG: hypothetical protein UU01_C0030G0008 [Parcubacteria group bacterium GW2011_GWA2_40_37]KKT21925.1 MAG: hypothetical protein UW07_C0052G0009 [Candidatus Nomurabacteria bacterium GW2011_GWF2_43_8]OGI73379.1 MAG: hypothetical protein A2W56_02590 [Candidatus Nomurabacteria bacterium RIFCSPHIGHO2_02_41_18]OGJ03233.1 MAG: hypothetical protein A3G48_03490 [Candidatus Nomurabacteria bacteri
MKNLIESWHSLLNMPKHDLAWHTEDIADEFEEFKEARGFIDKWSELSDVAYTYTRAQWSGHKNVEFPFKQINLYIGFLYMLPKYTLRWRFFRVLGEKFNKNIKITEVRNSKKIEKLEHIAKKYNLDPTKFKDEAKKLMKRWVFLK